MSEEKPATNGRLFCDGIRQMDIETCAETETTKITLDSDFVDEESIQFSLNYTELSQLVRLLKRAKKWHIDGGTL